MSRPALIAAALLLFLGPGTVRDGAAQAGKRTAPRLLLHDWFGTSPVATPTFVRDHREFLESQPFDGLALYLRTPNLELNVTAKVLSTTKLRLDDIREVLKPVAALPFQTLRHNFAAVLSMNPPDLFDDWSSVVQNFANLAQAAREARLEGLYIDNENYGSHWTDYPSGVAYPARTLREYQDQARLRGSEIMKAVTAVFPDVVVIVLHGPYVSEPKAPHPLFPSWELHNRLQGPFFAGFVEGAGPEATCVDGGELYHLRTPEDFRKSYDWRRSDLVSDRVNCAYLPAAVRARWPRTVGIAFGLYDKPFGGSPMDPPALRACVERALRKTDRYVWLYIEGPSFLRSEGKGGASAEWVTAVRQGREEALRPRPP